MLNWIVTYSPEPKNQMLIHKETESLILKAPDPLQIRGLIPQSKVLNRDDYNVAVKHTVESARILRNIGIDAPAPIRWQYRWPGQFTPMEHQIQMAEFQTLYRRAYNLSEPGTAKTAPALWASDWMMETGRVRKTLIIAPLSTLETVWMKNIFKILLHRKCIIVHRQEGAENLKIDVDFYIMNHDGVRIKAIRDYIKKCPEIDNIIVDEGDFFRNRGPDKFKYLQEMIRPDVRLWWMTGTPCPQAPTDAWTQATIVNPSTVPKIFGAFQRMTMMDIGRPPYRKWVPRPEAYNLAYKALQPAIRFTKDECLDLPPVTVHDLQAELTPEQNKQYKTMLSQMVAEAKTTTITAANAADRLIKLRQILCGSIKDPQGDRYIDLPHAPRVQVLLEAIQQAAAKVYIIVPFTGIIHSLARDLTKAGVSVEVLNGEVSMRERNRIVERFKTQTDPRALLCHPEVTSHGLDFTEADTMIMYAPIYSNAQFGQIIERFNRPGQTRHMRIVRIGAKPLEWKIYGMLDSRRQTQENILNLFKSVIES